MLVCNGCIGTIVVATIVIKKKRAAAIEASKEYGILGPWKWNGYNIEFTDQGKYKATKEHLCCRDSWYTDSGDYVFYLRGRFFRIKEINKTGFVTECGETFTRIGDANEIQSSR
jgi:hypothetical protein